MKYIKYVILIVAVIFIGIFLITKNKDQNYESYFFKTSNLNLSESKVFTNYESYIEYLNSIEDDFDDIELLNEMKTKYNEGTFIKFSIVVAVDNRGGNNLSGHISKVKLKKDQTVNDVVNVTIKRDNEIDTKNINQLGLYFFKVESKSLSNTVNVTIK